MCGRFTISKTEEELEKRFGASFYSRVLEARYNIAPTRFSPVITAEDPRQFQFFRWGLIPFWAKDASIGARMINARSESVVEKPAFRQAFERRRCLVIADGWYEWQKIGNHKQPFRILKRNGDAFAMAGLWERWKVPVPNEQHPQDDLHSFTIITKAALPGITHIHDRMPAVLLPETERLWLDPELPPSDLMGLLHSCPDEALRAYKVSAAVNNAAMSAHPCSTPCPTEPFPRNRDLSLPDHPNLTRASIPAGAARLIQGFHPSLISVAELLHSGDQVARAAAPCA